MPITILDYVKSQIGEKDSYPAHDFYSVGVDITGGCEICGATLAAYNAYPSTSGYWRCADCIGTDGFTTVEEFSTSGTGPDASEPPYDTDTALLNCPACGAVENVTEIWENVFKCGGCRSAWRL
jgi:hypothetical protein